MSQKVLRSVGALAMVSQFTHKHSRRRRLASSIETAETRTMLSGVSLGFVAGYESTPPDSISLRTVAVAENGDVYSTGLFNGSTDFDPGVGEYVLESSRTDDSLFGSAFVSRLDSQGQHIRTIDLDSESGHYVRDLVIDSQGNILLTGRIEADTDFDPSDGVAIEAVDKATTFIAKYDADLNLLWSTALRGSGSTIGWRMAVDAKDNVYLGGDLTDTINFDADGNEEVTYSQGNFILKLDADGDFQNVMHFGQESEVPSDFRMRGMDVSKQGDVAVIGSFNSTLDIDLGPGEQLLTSAGADDIFVARFNRKGNLAWAGQVGGTGNDSGRSILFDPNTDELVFTYTTWNFGNEEPLEMDVDPGPDRVTRTIAPEGRGTFVTRFSEKDGHQWTMQFDERAVLDSPDSTEIRITEDSELYVTGYYRESFDIDPLGRGYQLPTEGPAMFIASWDSSGQLTSAVTPKGESFPLGLNLGPDKSPHVLLSGQLNDFNPGRAKSTAEGSQFVWKLQSDSKVYLPSTTQEVSLKRSNEGVLELIDETNNEVLLRKQSADGIHIDARGTDGVTLTVEQDAKNSIAVPVRLTGSLQGENSLVVSGGGDVLYRPHTNKSSTEKLRFKDFAIRLTRVSTIDLSGLDSLVTRTTAESDSLLVTHVDGAIQLEKFDGADAPVRLQVRDVGTFQVHSEGGNDSMFVASEVLADETLQTMIVDLGYGSDALFVRNTTEAPDPTTASLQAKGGGGEDSLRIVSDSDFRITNRRVLTGIVESFRHSKFEQAAFLGGDSDNLIDGSAFDGPVSLGGGSGDDTLIGSGYDDFLDGGDGDDQLFGGNGIDRLDGDRGSDTLTGGGGFDLLDGGGEADVYRIEGSKKGDQIEFVVTTTGIRVRSVDTNETWDLLQGLRDEDLVDIRLFGGKDIIDVAPDLAINGRLDAGGGRDECNVPDDWDVISC